MYVFFLNYTEFVNHITLSIIHTCYLLPLSYWVTFCSVNEIKGGR